MPKGGAKIAALSKYHNQQHFEPLLPHDRMRMPGGHHNGFALVQDVLYPIHGDLALAIQAGDKRVAARGMGADFFAISSFRVRTSAFLMFFMISFMCLLPFLRGAKARLPTSAAAGRCAALFLTILVIYRINDACHSGDHGKKSRALKPTGKKADHTGHDHHQNGYARPKFLHRFFLLLLHGSARGYAAFGLPRLPVCGALTA